MDSGIGSRLRALRVEQGLSLTAFAKRVFYTKGYLSRVETGAQAPSAEFVRRCDAELGAGGSLVALRERPARTELPVASPAGGGEEIWIMTMTPDGSSFHPIGRREAMLGGAAALVAGMTMPHGRAAATSVHEQLAYHRTLFDATRELGQTAAPAAVLPLLVGQAQALRLLSRQLSGRVTGELTGLAARTAEFAGWMAQEDGDDAAALWWTERAVEVAKSAGDDYVAAYALVRRALISMNRGDADSTIGLAQRAQAQPGTPARVRGLAAQREAQGHALKGNYDECMRALDRAGQLLRVPHADQPAGPTIGTAHVADPVAVVTGWCLHDLGRPREAAEVLDREVARIPESAVRARTRFGTRRALAHAASGELEQACVLTREIVDNLDHIQSATIRAEVRKLAKTLRRWPGNAHVRSVDPALTAALTSAS